MPEGAAVGLCPPAAWMRAAATDWMLLVTAARTTTHLPVAVLLAAEARAVILAAIGEPGLIPA